MNRAERGYTAHGGRCDVNIALHSAVMELPEWVTRANTEAAESAADLQTD